MQQASRMQFTVNAKQLAQGFAEFVCKWPKPFMDVNYTLIVTASHRSIGGTEAGKSAYANCGWRDKTIDGFMPVVAIIPGRGAAVNDPIEIDAIAIHD
jgi:hypothetical protein